MKHLIFTGLLVLVGCAAPPHATPPDRSSAGPLPGTTAREAMSHHALIRGTVVGAAGQALDSVQVVIRDIVETDRAAMPANRAFSDRRGRFTIPAQAYVARPGTGDTAQVHVVVVAIGLAQRFSGGGTVPVDSAVVALTLVPVDRAPPAAEVRLRLAVPPP